MPVFLRSFETETAKIPGDMLRDIFLYMQRVGNQTANPDRYQAPFKRIDEAWLGSEIAQQERLLMEDAGTPLPPKSPLWNPDFGYDATTVRQWFDAKIPLSDMQAEAVAQLITNFNLSFSPLASDQTISPHCWHDPWRALKQERDEKRTPLLAAKPATKVSGCKVVTPSKEESRGRMKAYTDAMKAAIGKVGGLSVFADELAKVGYPNGDGVATEVKNLSTYLSPSSRLNGSLFSHAMKVFSSHLIDTDALVQSYRAAGGKDMAASELLWQSKAGAEPQLAGVSGLAR